jgi:site-specific DNA-methyltransferase (adenine-specific)/adenine-specific DNA-methyltransferase
MLVLDEEVSFETPKPVDLVRRIVAIGCDKTSIFMDAFVGSGTTGHAVLAQNAADGGTRRFLAIEMDPDIGRDVTAQRLARVIGGYTPRGKTDPVPGLGGGFRYCTLGESLFDETGAIRSTVRFPALAAHVFFAETGSPLLAPVDGTSPLLGAHEGRAVYLLYNGVLGDRRPESGNVLTADVLRALPPHDGQKVVFGEGCTVPRERLVRAGFEFRQVPYELRVG